MINDECLERLMKSIEASNKKTIEEANKKQTIDIREYIKQQIEELSDRFEEKLKKSNEEHETRYNQLKLKYDKLEKQLRKNNVIIFGLENQEGNLVDCVLNTLNNYLQLTLSTDDIDNVYKVGKIAPNQPIVVKLTTYIKKLQILKNCKKLKGTPISIGEQLSPEEQNENRILRKHLKIARENKQTAIIRNNKLIVSGQKYSVQDLETKEESTENIEIINGQQAESAKTISILPPFSLNPPFLSIAEGHEKYTQEKETETLKKVTNSEIQTDSKKNKHKINNEPLTKVKSSARLRINSEKKNREPSSEQ